MPTIRTGFKSAAATVWFVEPDLIKGGAGSSKACDPDGGEADREASGKDD